MKCYITDDVMILLFFLLNLPLFHPVIVQALSDNRIQLYAYNQSESKTSCQVGLINKIDNYVVRGLANFAGSLPLIPTVAIEIYNGSIFEDVCYIYIDQGCTDFTRPCYCENTTTAGLYQFTVNRTAITSETFAKMRAMLTYTNNTRQYSHVIHLPGIYDPATNTKTQITVNGLSINPGSSICSVVIYKPQLTIEYSCLSDYSPCWLEVSLNDSATVPQRHKNYIYFQTGEDLQNYSLIVFRRAACQLGIAEETTTCIIFRENNHDVPNHLYYVGYFFAVFVPGTFVLVLCCVAFRTKCWKRDNCVSSICDTFTHCNSASYGTQSKKRSWADTTPLGERDSCDEL